MALLSGKDLERLTGVAQKNLYNYRKREHLIRDESTKLYDDQNIINAEFIRKFSTTKDLVHNNQPKSTKNSTRSQRKTSKKQGVESKKDDKTNGSSVNLTEYSQLSQEKLELEVQIKRANLAKSELEIKKKSGELIELSETIKIIKDYQENRDKNLLSNMSVLIQDLCTRYNLGSEVVGKYKKKVVDLMNKTNSDTFEELSKKLVL